MTTAPRLNSRQIKTAAFFWRAHQFGTLEIAARLGVAEACVANSLEDIKAMAKTMHGDKRYKVTHA